MTRVLLIDDHELVRVALRGLLEAQPDLEVVAAVGSIPEALVAARANRPDLVITDVSLPGPSGIDAIPQLLAEHPGLRILVLSLHDEPFYVRRALAAGVHGYLLKDAIGVELIRAIREVAQGGRYVQPSLERHLGGPGTA